jgi:HK97 family phage major capsid protein
MSEQAIDTINASLKKVGDDLKSYAEQSAKEIKRTGELQAETRAKVDELLTKQGELQARLQAAEQMVANIETVGEPARPKSWGEQVVESEAFAGFQASPGQSFRVKVQGAITSDQGSGGQIVRPDRVPGIVPGPEQRLTIRDLLNWGRTSSNSVEFVRETGFDNRAAPVEENPSDPKPQSTLTFELAAAPVATIAHWVLASRQVLSDMAMLQSYIDGRLRYGLKLKEEAQLLKGSGIGLNIDGIYTQASAYSAPSGANVAGETNIDRLRLALLQVELADYMADAIVLHPTDWANIELTKDSELRYIFANVVGQVGPRLWGRPVVATKSLDQDEFLVGAFSMGAQGWDREDISVRISLEDLDNFRKNMVTILCEERLALTVYRPESFVKGEFSAT